MSTRRPALAGAVSRSCWLRRRAGSGAASLVGALLVSALMFGSGASAMTRRSSAVAPPLAVVTIHPLARGRPIPAGFVGLSLEYRTLLTYLGTDPKAINPVFVRLLGELAPGQTPVVRIGGDSTDWTWWPVPNMQRPRGVTYDLTPAWLGVARALAQATGAHYILGINLEADVPAIEAAEADALLSGIGRRS